VGQLLAAGLSREGVKGRVERGTLHRVHRGVYRVGHRAPSTEARYMAAVLTGGEKAVLSGHAAAFLWWLVRGPAPAPEVSMLTNRRIAGVITRRLRKLDPLDVTSNGGIPLTTVPRTLLDLAASLSLEALARACHEAEVRHGTGAATVFATLARKPNAPGSGKLRDIFGGDARLVLSTLERDFLAILRAAELPLPQTNRPVDGRYVDCRWPEHRLTVELDSYRYHHSRHAWERDRRREREARARGDEFRRYTYGDVTDDRALMLAELRGLLPSSIRCSSPTAPEARRAQRQ
jgi:hypothetical protein